MQQISKRLMFVLPIFVLIAMLVQCMPNSLTLVSPLPPPTLTEIALRQMLVAKVTDLTHISQTEEAARLIPRTKISGPTYLPVTPQPVPGSFPTLEGNTFAGVPLVPAGNGYITHGLPPYYNHGFAVENIWIADNETRTARTYVSAGYVMAPGGFVTQQGLVDIRVLRPDGSFSFSKQYLTSTQSGSLHIVDAVGERLILKSANGTAFYFDVPSHQFVSSLEAVVPTFMPSPISPLATPNSPIATPN